MPTPQADTVDTRGAPAETSPRRPRRGRPRKAAPVTEFARRQDETVAQIIARAEADHQGLLYKLFRTRPIPPDGRPLTFLRAVEHDATIEDLELYLDKIGRAAGWGDGDYQVRLFRGREPEPVWVGDFSYDDWGPKRAADPGPGAALDPFDQAQKSVNLAQGMMAAAGGTAGKPEALVSMFIEGLKSAKGDSAGLLALLPLVTPLVTALGAMLTKITDPRPQQSDLDIVARIKSLGLLGERDAGPEDGRDTLDEIKRYADTARTLSTMFSGGGGPAPAPSAAAELFRNLNYVPEIIRPFAAGFSTLLQGAGLWLAAKAGAKVNLPVLATPEMAPRPVSDQPAPASTAPAARTLLSEFRHAITEGNCSPDVFRRLVAVFGSINGGAEAISGLRGGMISLAMLRQQPGAEVHFPELSIPGSEPFFERFTAWLRSSAAEADGHGAAAPAAAPASPRHPGEPLRGPVTEGMHEETPTDVVAVCTVCGETYDAEDLDDLRAEFGVETCASAIRGPAGPQICGGALRPGGA